MPGNPFATPQALPRAVIDALESVGRSPGAWSYTPRAVVTEVTEIVAADFATPTAGAAAAGTGAAGAGAAAAAGVTAGVVAGAVAAVAVVGVGVWALGESMNWWDLDHKKGIAGSEAPGANHYVSAAATSTAHLFTLFSPAHVASAAAPVHDFTNVVITGVVSLGNSIADLFGL